MTRRGIILTLALVGVLAHAVEALEPPVAPCHAHFTVTHGDTLRDDYHWMHDKEDPEVRAYLEAENEYTAAVMQATESFQQKLYGEMLARVQETDRDVPYREGSYYYYQRTEEGKQYPIHCRRKGGMDAPEEVLIDVNRLAEGHEFMRVGDFEVSDDGNLIAYTTDDTGYRQYRLHVLDLRTGELLPGLAERVTAVAWGADNQTVFYCQEDSVTKRWYRIYRFVPGSDDEHHLVYEETDDRFDVWLYRSRSREFVFVVSESATTSEVWFIRRGSPDSPMTSIDGRREGHEYHADHSGSRFFIRTNDTGRNFRLVTAPVSSPGEGAWSQVYAHRDDVMLEDVDCFARYYVMHERENGVPRVRVVDMRSGRSHRIDFPEPVYVVEGRDNREFDTRYYRLVYESFVTPESVLDYEMQTREMKLLKEKPVLGGYDRKQYSSERVHATAADGTRIPISMVYRNDRKPRNRPMLLLGYGSYGYPLDVWFSSDRLSLLDRGVIFAIAHVRGGGDLGKQWHEDGRLMEKTNTFTDFIACAEHLIEKNYTSADRLAATGRSAGGLLMGSVVNMRPELFRVVVTGMPFVDVMNTMLDPTIPLTTSEYLEWGDPNEKAAYDYMKRYSPYDNVGRHDYPAMLVTTSLNDSQVGYWEPAKWVARIRASRTGGGVLLLRTRMEPGGHGGASGRYDRLRDTAFEYTFLLTRLGISE